jgi:hypothetical protein
MSAVKIRAYWPPIKTVIVPVGIMKIILMTIAACYALILIVGYFWKGHWGGVLPLLSVLAFFYLFIMVILLPTQALTAVSSKSLRYLTDFRKFYFVVAFLLALIFPLMMIFLQWITASPTKDICAEGFCAAFNATETFDGVKKLIHMALQVWLLSSFILAWLFFATYRLPILSAPIFIIFVFLKPIFQQLSQVGFLPLCITLIMIWFVFGVWWLRLKPQKYIMNNYGMTMEQMMATGTTANPSVNPQVFALTNLLTTGVKPASLLGTRLLGSPDGKTMVIPSWIYIFIMGLLLFLFLKWLMGDNNQRMVHYASIYSSVFLLYMGASASLTALCRNIKPLWLFYPGTRKQMLLFVERKSLLYASALILISPVLAGFFYYLANAKFIDVTIFSGIILSAILFIALGFYLSLAIYTRDKDGKLGASGWQGVGTLINLSLFTIICYLWIDAHYMSTLIINSVVLASLLVLRNYLIKKWQTINFVRVG